MKNSAELKLPGSVVNDLLELEAMYVKQNNSKMTFIMMHIIFICSSNWSPWPGTAMVRSSSALTLTAVTSPGMPRTRLNPRSPPLHLMVSSAQPVSSIFVMFFLCRHCTIVLFVFQAFLSRCLPFHSVIVCWNTLSAFFPFFMTFVCIKKSCRQRNKGAH